MSVVEEIVPVLTPPDREKTIDNPPTLIALFAASRACRVRVEVDPALIEAEETATVDAAAEAVPGVTETVGKVVVTAEPSKVDVIVVAEPEMAPVKIAE